MGCSEILKYMKKYEQILKVSVFVPIGPINTLKQRSNGTNRATIKHKQFVCSVWNDIWESTTPGEDNTLESYGLELRRPLLRKTVRTQSYYFLLCRFTKSAFLKSFRCTVNNHCCLVVKCSVLHSLQQAVLCISCNRRYLKHSSNNKFIIHVHISFSSSYIKAALPSDNSALLVLTLRLRLVHTWLHFVIVGI